MDHPIPIPFDFWPAILQQIDLIEHLKLGNLARTDLPKHIIDLGDTGLPVVAVGIDHVQQQRRFGGFLQG